MRHSGSLRLRLSCRKVRIGAAAKGLAALPLGAGCGGRGAISPTVGV